MTTATTIEARALDQPDEVRRPDRSLVEVLTLGGHTIGRFTFKPGWSWAGCIKPVAGTDHCEKHHVGFCISGRIEVWQPGGERVAISAGDAYVIPPGHDAEVVGDQDWVAVEFASAATYAVPS